MSGPVGACNKAHLCARQLPCLGLRPHMQGDLAHRNVSRLGEKARLPPNV